MDISNSCRCCLLRPPEKDLKAAYPYLDKYEVYSEMLKECFEIHLSLDSSSNGICEVCITRLRDACDFKAQVQNCQKELQHCKEEITAMNIKEEMDPDNALALKAEPTDFSTEYLEDNVSEDDCKLADLLGLNDVTVKRKKRKKLCPDKNDKKSKKLLKISLSTLGNGPAFVNLSEHQKHKVNIDNIFKYSNCTPFLNKTISGIICTYCRGIFQNLNSLRSHVDFAHKTASFNEKGRDRTNITIKVDITDLKCKICDSKFDIISNLKKHLIKEHDIKFYPDVFDYIVEFKLTDSEVFNCALCNSSYETFKMLLQHMNIHYKNYLCDSCELGFINMHRLKTHQKTHEVGSFKCAFCEKVFTTKVRKVCHEKYTHNTNARYTTSCPHCDQSFNSYYQRNRHMYKEHNSAAATYKCNICDKLFILKSKLTSHIKKVHLMERNHICSECGQGFFIKQSLDEHMIKHNGERVYKCTVCQKAYARKKTLREHLRIHNNDRRFKCGVCGLAFVQKCSLKSHMLSNHGITLAEFESAKLNITASL